ncbi:formate dehydrogenase accessory sulfurtransferase FdhD [Phragmitibacter flavus]|uniref:Sulfur carrier protein FdhD n=1 Tax=Phragmitibacter flavus TaxID=2576071 RepID=A0A5R8KCH5_9BACT|nr:formate dehydrogenase accessory sulfurtransferase FdhD [Phragmitibacter flavus]TLD69635.1 formate dehydrogenase accessory sulfurtransferase FdhD [Phragmitibacter flavus]
MSPAISVTVDRFLNDQHHATEPDWVATEEPLELRLEGRALAVIMRTPGHDEDLAAGFLLTEGIIKKSTDLFELSVCPSNAEGESKGNVVEALLSNNTSINWDNLTRHVFTSSSCGLCGKATIDSIFQIFPPVTADWQIPASIIRNLPDKLRQAQDTFTQTGGLHASALFDLEGNLIVLREDVGRHNALDKVLGHALRHNLLPLNNHLLMVSGRVSFEIIQKALAANIPLIAAVSAPSSLAVEFAQSAHQTLIGFLRGNKMNIYTHPQRIQS